MQKNNFTRLLFNLALIALTVPFAACAVGNKYDLATSAPEMSQNVDAKAAVGVHDRRAYILDGDKTTDFVGLQRGGFGNPFDVTTKSGQAVAEDFTNSVVQGLEKAGIDTEKVTISHSQTPTQAKDTILSVGSDRALMVVINKFKSDTYTNVRLTYELSAFVYGKDGTLLAQNQITGSKNLGGNAWNPPAYATKAVPEALSEKLDDLLDTPEILQALGN